MFHVINVDAHFLCSFYCLVKSVFVISSYCTREPVLDKFLPYHITYLQLLQIVSLCFCQVGEIIYLFWYGLWHSMWDSWQCIKLYTLAYYYNLYKRLEGFMGIFLYHFTKLDTAGLHLYKIYLLIPSICNIKSVIPEGLGRAALRCSPAESSKFFFVWDRKIINYASRSGGVDRGVSEGSVRLLLTKNLACSFSCPLAW